MIGILCFALKMRARHRVQPLALSPRSPCARTLWVSVSRHGGVTVVDQPCARMVPRSASAWRWPAPTGRGLAPAVPCAGTNRGCGCHRSVDMASTSPLVSPTASCPWRMPLPPCLVIGPVTGAMGCLPASFALASRCRCDRLGSGHSNSSVSRRAAWSRHLCALARSATTDRSLALSRPIARAQAPAFPHDVASAWAPCPPFKFA